MLSIRPLMAAAALAAAFAIPVGAQQGHKAHQEPGTSAGNSDQAFMKAHEAMMNNMNIKPTGNADRDFATMMIPHHQSAIDMARIQLRYGKDPEMRRLAEKIITDQEREIAELRGWLDRNR